MSAPKWTPGPWRAEPMGKVFAIRPGQTGFLLASTCDSIGYDSGKYLGEAEADARLIAAAPELYEALASVLDAWEESTNCGGSIGDAERIMFGSVEDARSALAKAVQP